MADVNIAFNYLMDDEDRSRSGKVTYDAGGLTRYGISQHSYPEEDIANLTLDRAKQIYVRDYWTPINGDKITSQQIANKLLDIAVNLGVVHAVRLLQLALNLPSHDGLLGPVTLAKTNAADPDKLMSELRARQAVHYATYSESNLFLGLMRRAVR